MSVIARFGRYVSPALIISAIAAILATVMLVSSASANHNINWMTKIWSGTSHGTLYQQGGFDWHHFSQERWRGRAYDFGDGRTFSSIRIYNLAAVSCTNGNSWLAYTTSGSPQTFYNVITATTGTTGDLPIPSCNSAPKYWVRVCGTWVRNAITVRKDWNFYDAGSGTTDNGC